MPDDDLRQRLLIEALRLQAAVAALEEAGSPSGVAYAGRTSTVADLRMHGRSEAALHRWDLAGDDDVSIQLLGQPELTSHAVVVLNEMVDGSSEATRARAGHLGASGVRLAFATPGQPDVVLVAGPEGARLELDEPTGEPVAVAPAAVRLLALWGRRSHIAEIDWYGPDARRDQLASFLWAARYGPVRVGRSAPY